MRLWTWAKRWFALTVATALGGIWVPVESIQNRVFGTGVVFLVVTIVLAVASDGEETREAERLHALERRQRQLNRDTIDGDYW